MDVHAEKVLGRLFQVDGPKWKVGGGSVGEVGVQFNSIQKNLIIPQGAILLWSWQAHKKYIKLRKQYNKQKSYFNRSIVINIEQL